jgi:hypothetical protein
MSTDDIDGLRRELEKEERNAEQVSIEENEDAGTVTLRVDDGREIQVEPDAARSFADELQSQAEEDGWYHSGGTEPFVDRVREAAGTVE